jgi:hypothetical protein
MSNYQFLKKGFCSIELVTVDSFSREAWVETNQKNAMQQGGEVWDGPTILVCFLAGSSQVMCYRAKLTSVAKYTLQLSEMVQARLAMSEW